MALSWNTKWRWDTGYSADSVEWCPVEPYRHVLVCGTYQLDKGTEGETQKKQTRLGKIYLFTVDENITHLSPIQTIETAGVLDQKWCYHEIQGHPTLAIATSVGTIQLYQLLQNPQLNLKLWIDHSIGLDVISLSLDWSTNKTHSDEPRIVVSDSSGSVTVLKVVSDGLEKIATWKSHGFEAWIAAFNYWNTDLFYSGGDDCLFKSYDVRLPDAVAATNRSHEAGVTAIRSDLNEEHCVMTGSYDEKVRTWDARKLKSCVSETDAGGGVWRLKWHPRTRLVAAACMYGGFRLLKDGSVASEYREHESIAYGVDWSHEPHGYIATCSFYDCKLHVSEVDVD